MSYLYLIDPREPALAELKVCFDLEFASELVLKKVQRACDPSVSAVSSAKYGLSADGDLAFSVRWTTEGSVFLALPCSMLMVLGPENRPLLKLSKQENSFENQPSVWCGLPLFSRNRFCSLLLFSSPLKSCKKIYIYTPVIIPYFSPCYLSC